MHPSGLFCRDAMMNVDEERGEIEHVILSEAKDVRHRAIRAPMLEILRFAQDDMKNLMGFGR